MSVLIAFTFLLSACAHKSTPEAAKPKQEKLGAMIVDSSYAPMRSENLELETKATCPLIHEADPTVPQTGPCYDETEWSRLSQIENSYFSDRKSYLLAAHGSRSAWLLLKNAGADHPLTLVRSLSSQAGTLSQREGRAQGLSPGVSYGGGCGLRKWAMADVEEIGRGKKLLDHQERLSRLLTQNPRIKVVSLSLGYKLSWIREENSLCSSQQVALEYEVLRLSWFHFFRRHADRLFFVAAGNEGADLDKARDKEDELWASFRTKPANLVLVGALDSGHYTAGFSNYGAAVDLWAPGDKLKVRAPDPRLGEGLEREFSGTSVSTPIVAGTALKIWDDIPNASPTEIIAKLGGEYRSKIYETFFRTCGSDPEARHLCLPALLVIARSKFLWEPASSTFAEAQKNWEGESVQVVFSQTEGREGTQKLQEKKGRLQPVISLRPDADPFELLITLNHELVHAAHSRDHGKHIKDSSKVNDCLTRYRLEALRDEKSAFEAEIAFWKNAPNWFRTQAATQKFDSRLLDQKNIDYGRYYDLLEKHIKEDPWFVPKRYVEMGEYPNCAKDLLATPQA